MALLGGACSGQDEAEPPATTAPPQAQVVVALALDVDAAGLASAASAVARPDGPDAGQFLTLDEVASRHGAPADTIDSTVSALRALGIDATPDPTGGALWATVDVATAEAAFDVELIESTTAGGATVVYPSGSPTVPDGIDGVTAVIGLTATTAEAPAPPTSATAEVPPCPADPMTRTGLIDRFGADPLTSTGSTGAGTTVVVVEIETFDPAVASAYAACGDTDLPTGDLTQTAVAQTPDASSGPEVALDLVALGLVAPDAAVRVTRFDPETSIVLPLLQIVTDAQAAGATPDVVLSTIGFCETSLTADEVALAEWLLAALAATGTSTIASSGDTGSSACHPSSDDPAVQYPASSAWVLSVGGAQYTGSADAPSGLAVWNDSPSRQAAAGGGSSTVVARPAWQSGTGVDGDHRLVPDVAGLAQPGGLGQVPVCDASGCRWEALGGTSATAAVVAGLATLAAEHDAAGGGSGRLGLLAPAVTTTTSSGGPAATDVTAGDNQLFTDRCCTAAPGFDQASGWGLLDVAALMAALDGRS